MGAIPPDLIALAHLLGWDSRERFLDVHSASGPVGLVAGVAGDLGNLIIKVYGFVNYLILLK